MAQSSLPIVWWGETAIEYVMKDCVMHFKVATIAACLSPLEKTRKAYVKRMKDFGAFPLLLVQPTAGNEEGYATLMIDEFNLLAYLRAGKFDHDKRNLRTFLIEQIKKVRMAERDKQDALVEHYMVLSVVAALDNEEKKEE
jgi:hypothetical protein